MRQEIFIPQDFGHYKFNFLQVRKVPTIILYKNDILGLETFCWIKTYVFGIKNEKIVLLQMGILYTMMDNIVYTMMDNIANTILIYSFI